MAAALVRTTLTTPAATEVSWFRSWNLKWLVPLTAGAAAVAIWFALPDERRRNLTVQNQSRPEVAVSASRPSEREASSDERLLQPRSAVAEPDAQSDHTATVAPRTEPPNGPKAAEARAKGQRERTELSAGQDKSAASEEKQTVEALRKETDSLAKIAPPAAPSATTADAVATQSASVPSKAAQSAAGQSPASPAGTPAPAGPPLPAAKRAAPSELGAATSSSNANAAEPTGTTGRRDQAAREIQSPDRSVRWRIVGRGLIQRSSDAGATWESLQTESTTELTAGSAPTPLVCWLVGRAGAVLLSTDGRRFVRLPSPSPTDLVAVQATDARSAIVTEAGGRTYRTSDAGTTWEPLR